MQTFKKTLVMLSCAGVLCIPTLGHSADAKTYQVTGPVLEVTPTTITVQKGDEKWQLSRGSGTKVTGDVKVGAKVTVYYQMVASEIEVKTGKSEGAKGEGKTESKKKKES